MPFRRPLRSRSSGERSIRENEGGRYIAVHSGRPKKGISLTILGAEVPLKEADPLQLRAVGRGMRVLTLRTGRGAQRAVLRERIKKWTEAMAQSGGLEIETIGTGCFLALSAFSDLAQSAGSREPWHPKAEPALPEARPWDVRSLRSSGNIASRAFLLDAVAPVRSVRLNMIAPPLQREESVRTLPKAVRCTIYIADRDPSVNYHDPYFVRSTRALGARVFYAEGADRRTLLLRVAQRKRFSKAPLPHAVEAYRRSVTKKGGLG